MSHTLYNILNEWLAPRPRYQVVLATLGAEPYEMTPNVRIEKLLDERTMRPPLALKNGNVFRSDASGTRVLYNTQRDVTLEGDWFKMFPKEESAKEESKEETPAAEKDSNSSDSSSNTSPTPAPPLLSTPLKLIEEAPPNALDLTPAIRRSRRLREKKRKRYVE